MTSADEDSQTLPLTEETLRVGRRQVETGRVRVNVRTQERQQPIRAELLREEVVVERVRVERFAETEPEMRQEGDVLIVPVFEEVLVKRILVREELHIRRKRLVTELDETVSLKRQEAIIERISAGDPPNPPGE